MTTARTHTTIRPAVTGDIDDIAAVWHTGWRDAHLGRVPSSLLAHRQLGDLRVRVPVRLDTTSVASVGSRVAGFVVTHLDEIEQLYLHAAFRGTGIAAELLAHGEGVIVAGFDRAWLAVVDGNARARRFYERHGWIDTGMFDNPAWMPDGTTIPVPSRRYEKHLADPARRAPHALRRASARPTDKARHARR